MYERMKRPIKKQKTCQLLLEIKQVQQLAACFASTRTEEKTWMSLATHIIHLRRGELCLCDTKTFASLVTLTLTHQHCLSVEAQVVSEWCRPCDTQACSSKCAMIQEIIFHMGLCRLQFIDTNHPDCLCYVIALALLFHLVMESFETSECSKKHGWTKQACREICWLLMNLSQSPCLSIPKIDAFSHPTDLQRRVTHSILRPIHLTLRKLYLSEPSVIGAELESIDVIQQLYELKQETIIGLGLMIQMVPEALTTARFESIAHYTYRLLCDPKLWKSGFYYQRCRCLLSCLVMHMTYRPTPHLSLLLSVMLLMELRIKTSSLPMFSIQHTLVPLIVLALSMHPDKAQQALLQASWLQKRMYESLGLSSSLLEDTVSAVVTQTKHLLLDGDCLPLSLSLQMHLKPARIVQDPKIWESLYDVTVLIGSESFRVSKALLVHRSASWACRIQSDAVILTPDCGFDNNHLILVLQGLYDACHVFLDPKATSVQPKIKSTLMYPGMPVSSYRLHFKDLGCLVRAAAFCHLPDLIDKAVTVVLKELSHADIQSVFEFALCVQAVLAPSAQTLLHWCYSQALLMTDESTMYKCAIMALMPRTLGNI